MSSTVVNVNDDDDDDDGLCVCVCQETSSNAAAAKTRVTEGSSSELTTSGGAADGTSPPAVGQIRSIQRDGQVDVLWSDGSRSTTYLHHLCVIVDEVLKLWTLSK